MQKLPALLHNPSNTMQLPTSTASETTDVSTSNVNEENTSHVNQQQKIDPNKQVYKYNQRKYLNYHSVAFCIVGRFIY
jgi:hypothetical protein